MRGPLPLQWLQTRVSTIGALNGGIVRAAKATGVPARLNEAIADLIAGLKRSWSVESMPEEGVRLTAPITPK
jgi:hypothetical protein